MGKRGSHTRGVREQCWLDVFGFGFSVFIVGRKHQRHSQLKLSHRPKSKFKIGIQNVHSGSRLQRTLLHPIYFLDGLLVRPSLLRKIRCKKQSSVYIQTSSPIVPTEIKIRGLKITTHLFLIAVSMSGVGENIQFKK